MSRTTFNGKQSNILAWLISLLILMAIAYLAVAYIFGYKPFDKEKLDNDSTRSSLRSEASSTINQVQSSLSSSSANISNSTPSSFQSRSL